jgi:broad specificity phosphatase PhoE
MTPRITLLCHATTRALRSATFGGDDSLDDIGRARAERLAGSLGQVDHCWTSPARRARETAEALGLSPSVDERLRDCDYGRWSGLKFQQVLLKEPRKLVSWIRNPASAPHGGEPIPEVLARVADWMAERTKDKGHTVAVTHSAVIRAAVVHVIEAQLPSFWRIDVTPLSQTDLRTNGRRWVLRAIMPDEMRVRDQRPPEGGSAAPSLSEPDKSAVDINR